MGGHRFFVGAIPYPDRIHGVTSKPVGKWNLINGQYVKVNEVREVVATYFPNGSLFRCMACLREIAECEIGAKDYFSSYTYCIDCVKFDPPVFLVEYTYKLKRKSPKHPSGVITLRDVFTEKSLEQLKADLQSAGYPVIGIKRNPPV